MHDPILGDPSLAPRFDDAQVKGNLLAARRRWVEEKFGGAALAQVAEAASPSARAFLVEAPLAFAWYPFELMLSIDRAIIEGPMERRVADMYEFGNDIARYDLSTLYKVLFKIGTPGFVIRRIGVVYGQYLKPGVARGATPAARTATVTISDAVFPFYFCAYGISGWLRAAIELSGGQEVRAEQAACVHHGAPHCRFDLSWR